MRKKIPLSSLMFSPHYAFAGNFKGCHVKERFFVTINREGGGQISLFVLILWLVFLILPFIYSMRIYLIIVIVSESTPPAGVSKEL